jgi:hypothetical protein
VEDSLGRAQESVRVFCKDAQLRLSLYGSHHGYVAALRVLVWRAQGMFDNQTSMDLTACIFGLSTLLSSYQIYNVQNRIQVPNHQKKHVIRRKMLCRR